MKFLVALVALSVFAHGADPVLSTPEADRVDEGKTQLKVKVDTGGELTTLSFDYQPLPSDAEKLEGVIIPGRPDPDTVTVPANADPTLAQPVSVAGLIGGRDYSLFVKATNEDGSDREPEETAEPPYIIFNVPAYRPTVLVRTPTVDPMTISNPTPVTLKADVTPNGMDVFEVYFEYGPTVSYGSRVNGNPGTVPVYAEGTPETEGKRTLNVLVPVTAEPVGLKRGTLYHYRVIARNSITTGGDPEADPPVAPTTTIFTTTTQDATFTTPVNRAPIVRNESVSIKGDEPITINVLANDKDPDGDRISLLRVTQGKNGRVEIVGDRVTYTPFAFAKGGDTFTYTVTDDYTDAPKTATGTVTINAPALTSRGLHAAELKDADGNIVGTIRLYGTGSGSVSGKVHLYTKSYSVYGQIDANGNFYYTIPRNGDDAVQLHAKFGDASGAFDASLKSGDETWKGTAAPNTLTPARRDEIIGKYTVEFPSAGGSGDDAPQGIGYARLDVKPWGEVSIKGRLGDGTKYSTKGVLTGTEEVGTVSMWATSSNARVSALFSFGGSSASTVTGEMKWYRPPDDDADFFPNGFYAEITPNGSRFEPPEKRNRSLEGASKATLRLSDGNISQAITQNIEISKSDRINFLNANPYGVTLKIDRDNGTFKGEFDHPFDDSRRKFTGVIMQTQGKGSGVFTGINQTGAVALSIGATIPPVVPLPTPTPTPNPSANRPPQNNPNLPNLPNIPGFDDFR